MTTRYPAQPPDSWTVNLPSAPEFRADRLTDELADRLVAVCPSRALRRQGSDLVYDVGACTVCGRCLDVAAHAARPSGQLELAARNRADLIKRIPIEGGRR
ncbi:MAG: hypothetical protein ACR2KG_02135 [Nocardioidaceae bacterium]